MKLEIDNHHLTIKLNPVEKFLAVHGKDLKIPLDRIVWAAANSLGWQMAAVRAPGTHIPFLVKAGTYISATGREFWFATAGRKHLTIELEGWDYQRMVLAPGNPADIAETINKALPSFKSDNTELSQ